MKINKTLLCAAAIAVGAGTAGNGASAAEIGDAGCGLGAIILKGKPGAVQLFAATTNATSGSQTFGITTGTSHCSESALVAVHNQKTFIAMNKDALKAEIAKGQGEKLAAMAFLFGCESPQQARFNTALRSQYAGIFQEESDASVHYEVKEALKQDAVLAASCSKIIM